MTKHILPDSRLSAEVGRDGPDREPYAVVEADSAEFLFFTADDLRAMLWMLEQDG